MEYDFINIEKKWQDYWAKNKTFRAEDTSSKPKYYVLDMFPYPSGAGLHVGHPLGYIASDIVARYKRLKGFNVLHPMGYDSFGLPAEQYAIQTGQHPTKTTEENIKRYRQQLDKIGFSFDWDREVRTSDPNYYKWTQWIFIQLFNSWYNKETIKAEPIKKLISIFETRGFKGTKDDVLTGDLEIYHDGFSAAEWQDFSEATKEQVLQQFRLAYLSDAMVNWCPQLGTVLANEEVKDGVSERGGYPVERKLMKQWSLRITAYANRLLSDLDALDWSESIKEAQRNWIGKSEGTSICFSLHTPHPLPLSKGEGSEYESLTPKTSPKERGSTPGYHTSKKEIWKKLKEHSKENRKNPTQTEEILWEKVRDSKLGSKIRRQHVIDQFIADFICLDKKLIIEVDGDIHFQQQEYDKGRTFMLEEIGYRVIRFSNEEVITKTDWVCEEIKKALHSPLSFGEGQGGEAKKALPIGEDLGGAFIVVFTTRPDTIFGVSFVTLAPEHELVNKITTPEQKKAVDEYVTFAKNRSERERMADVKKITGVFTGAYVIHPFTEEQIPIWIGDYVLAGYGTGAVMAVPGHDSRDYAFAKHFDLPIKQVIAPPQPSPKEREFANPQTAIDGDLEGAWEEKSGTLFNSDFLNGLGVKDAVKKAIAIIEEKGLGKGKTNFRLRDAIFGRQRYWGEPIPVYYENGIPKVLSENELPLLLPEVDKYLPTETGEPPLARAKDWTYKPLSNSPQRGENAKPKWQTAADSTWDELKKRSNELRNNPTETEQILWQHLKAKQLNDKFRRQHVIGNNIVDFVCLDKNLIIEANGKIHDTQKEYDEARTKALESIGFRVIRFTNDEIIGNIDSVLERIKLALQSPLSFGEGQGGEANKVLPIGEDLGGAYEYSTMPGWAGSSWYFLRYMDAKNDKEFVSKEAANYWQNVDLYIGGSEHATGHLLYVRFWTKFLNDLGLIPVTEPAKKLINQGMIQGRSSFVYRTTFSVINSEDNPYWSGKIQEVIPPIFISKSYYNDPNEENNFNLLKEKFHEQNNALRNKFHDYNGGLTPFITPIHVDVNIVNNDILDIEAFKNWREEYKDAIFITEENGDYICGSEVEKMSKSKWNVVSPDVMVEQYGADCLRLYEMFLGPLEQSKPWNTNGITGVSNFIRKLWRLYHSADWNVTPLLWRGAGGEAISEEPANKQELKALHKTIKKIQDDIERFSFNTSVSNFMIFVNELTELKCNKRAILEPLAILIAPYAPHIAEELWSLLGHKESITYAKFPEYKEEYTIESAFNYPVSFNGKTKFFQEFELSLSKEDLEKEVLALEQTKKHLGDKQPKKVIVVHNKIVNIVV